MKNTAREKPKVRGGPLANPLKTDEESRGLNSVLWRSKIGLLPEQAIVMVEKCIASLALSKCLG